MTNTQNNAAQLFVSLTEDFVTTENTEDFDSTARAFASLVLFAQAEDLDITPEIEDGEIVYRITGPGVEGVATIS